MLCLFSSTRYSFNKANNCYSFFSNDAKTHTNKIQNDQQLYQTHFARSVQELNCCIYCCVLFNFVICRGDTPKKLVTIKGVASHFRFRPHYTTFMTQKQFGMYREYIALGSYILIEINSHRTLYLPPSDRLF